MNHLDQLESLSVHILREAYASFKNLGMLWSIGKDSTVLLWLARKADFTIQPNMLFNIDIWLSEGKTRREMFSEMNKLLQNEFLGGRITNDELKAGIQHIVAEPAHRDEASWLRCGEAFAKIYERMR